jgi:hypothetical protein
MVAPYVVPPVVVTANQAESVAKRVKSQLTAYTAHFAERLRNLMLESGRQ